MKGKNSANIEKHVWNDEVFVCVITMPFSRSRCDECEALLVGSGFPPPMRITGATRREGETMHSTVTRAHRKALEFYTRSKFHKTWHLLLLEDDARMHPGAVRRFHKLWRKLATLKWKTCHVGHVPLGPIVPLGSHVCLSTLPYSAHAVLYNRGYVAQVVHNPSQRWGRPWFFEGMLDVPLKERMGAVPSLFFQCQLPKEMNAIPFLRKLGYIKGEQGMLMLSLFQTVIVTATLALIIVIMAKCMQRSCRLRTDSLTC